MKRNWIIVGAVAAMIASASTGAGAQTTPDTTTPGAAAPTTTPPMTTPMPSGSMSTGTMPMSPPMSPGMMSPDAPDYTLLSNPLFDYGAIKSAKAKGLSDNQLASILRITKLTGMSYRSITDEVLDGRTFSAIAYDYNLKLSDVLLADTEKQQIPAFLAAYETTGSMAMKSMMSTNMPAPMPGSSMSPDSAAMAPTKDIVDTAMSNKNFSTLVKLLKQANLVDTLKGPGPFTVFAPTNAAFKKLPKNTVKNLTPDQLSKILTYHVLPAKVDAATAMAMTSPTSPPTVEGSTLQVTTQSGSVMINDAKVTQADIQTSNGIIHAIDTVLMPPDMPASPSAPSSTGTASATGSTTDGGAVGTTGSNTMDNTTTTATPAPAGTTGTPDTTANTGTATTGMPGAPAAGK